MTTTTFTAFNPEHDQRMTDLKQRYEDAVRREREALMLVEIDKHLGRAKALEIGLLAGWDLGRLVL